MAADIAYPQSLPIWRADGHSFSATPIVETTRWEQGEDRPRQIYRSAPRVVSVSALFRQPQFDRWVEFYEYELEAGTRPFDVRVASTDGGRVQWWTAQIVAPPMESTQQKARPHLTNLYLVSLQLLLLEGPSDTRVATTLRGLMQGASILLGYLGGTWVLAGRSVTTNTLRARLGAGSIYARIENVVTDTARLDYANLLLEDGDDVLQEDGASQVLLE